MAGWHNMPILVYRLGETPIQSCEQSVSAPRGKAGARLNAHIELVKASALGTGRDESTSAYQGPVYERVGHFGLDSWNFPYNSLD